MLVNLINVLWILIIINIVHYQYHLATLHNEQMFETLGCL